MEPQLTQRPALKRGCRLSTIEPLLLIPEGALRLQGPGRRILELCDGERSLADVIDELQAEYASAEPSKMSGEVVAFLKALAERGAIEFL
ncbi:MAG: pyrroloquinoline quinone biosynthesis peptide chaperone PqqD [Acidobacteriaceae bacterium]|nr:pyrroloquinoline quinone biosynthesis peptide chaperone PqqD [Acidobacteriaceae bacterium]